MFNYCAYILILLPVLMLLNYQPAAADSALDNYLKSLINNFRELLPIGHKMLDLPVMDPWKVPNIYKLVSHRRFRGRLKFTDITVTGLSKFEIMELKTELSSWNLFVKIRIPYSKAVGKYDINGVIMKYFPIYGDGNIRLKVEDLILYVGVKLKFDKNTLDLDIQNFKLNFDVQKLYIYLENIVGGGMLGRFANIFLNAYSKKLFYKFKPTFRNNMETVIYDYLKRSLKNSNLYKLKVPQTTVRTTITATTTSPTNSTNATNIEEDKSIALFLRKTIENLRLILPTGNKKLKIPPFDPYKAGEISINENDINLKIDDITIMGISGFQLEKMDVNLKKQTIVVKISIPHTNITGNYYLNGTILGFIPIYGNGSAIFKVKGFSVKLKATLRINTDIKRLECQNFHVQLGYDEAKVFLENLFGGEKFGQILNRVLNNLIISLFNSKKPDVEEIIRFLVLSFISDQLRKFDLSYIMKEENKTNIIVDSTWNPIKWVKNDSEHEIKISEYLTKTINNLKQVLSVGDKDSGIPSFDPLIVEDFKDFFNDENFKIHYQFTNVKISGIPNFQLTYINSDIKNYVVVSQILIENVNLTSDYFIDGKTLKLIPIYGNGTAEILVKNITIAIKGTIGVNDTTSTLKLKRFIIDLDYAEIDFNMENIMGGGVLGKLINNGLKRLFRITFKTMKSKIEMGIQNIILTKVNKELEELNIKPMLDDEYFTNENTLIPNITTVNEMADKMISTIKTDEKESFDPMEVNMLFNGVVTGMNSLQREGDVKLNCEASSDICTAKLTVNMTNINATFNTSFSPITIKVYLVRIEMDISLQLIGFDGPTANIIRLDMLQFDNRIIVRTDKHLADAINLAGQQLLPFFKNQIKSTIEEGAEYFLRKHKINF